MAALVLNPRCSLSPSERLLLLALASHGGPNSRGIFPSHETLAARTGMSIRSVGTHARNLLGLGALLVVHRPMQSNSHQIVLERLRAQLETRPAAGRARNRSARQATPAPRPFPTANQPAPERPSGEQAHKPPGEQTSEQASPSPGEQATRSCGLTEEQMAMGLCFIEEAGRDSVLHLDPVLLCLPVASWLDRQRLPEARSAECDRQPSPAGQQRAPGCEQEEPSRSATVADKPLHQPEQQLEQGELGATPAEQEPQMAVPPEEEGPPEAFEVKVLWERAWSRRHGGNYMAERSDSERLVFLARTAREKATVRQRVLAALQMPAESRGELAREYLSHCFEKFLGRSGQRTQEGVGFLELKRHPLRYLEEDLASLGEPWRQVTRVHARGLAKTGEPGLRRATPPPPELAGLVRAIASGQPLPPMRRPGGR